MQVSDKGLIFIAQHEGCVLKPYRDAVNVWTIGFGHTASAGLPNPKGHRELTVAEAIEIFRKDIKSYEKAVRDNVKFPMDQHQFDALVSFTYNLGAGNLQTLLRNRTPHQVSQAITKYVKAGGKTLTGLVKRRRAEQTMFLKGTYPTDTNCAVYRVGSDSRILWSNPGSVDLSKHLTSAPKPAEDSLPGPLAPEPEGSEKTSWVADFLKGWLR